MSDIKLPFQCETCGDHGWLVQGNGTADHDVVPCPDCNPEPAISEIPAWPIILAILVVFALAFLGVIHG